MQSGCCQIDAGCQVSSYATKGGRRWGEQGKPPLKTTRSQSSGTVSIRLMRIIYFAHVSSGSSQGKSLLDSADSQFSDSRLAKLFFSSLPPNTI